MCWHDWKEYKDIKENKYYRICRKCGIAQEGKKYANVTNLVNGTYNLVYETDKTLCRTNDWISRAVWRLKYGN